MQNNDVSSHLLAILHNLLADKDYEKAQEEIFDLFSSKKNKPSDYSPIEI